MSITVNADDFGISAQVNEAIAQSFENGLINRTTLMANMPYAQEAMKLAYDKGFADKVGIHINLTAGKPISNSISTNRVMCDEDGKFTADFARNMKTRFVLDAKTREEVDVELRAQLDEYKRLKGTMWHVDSHHHVHTDPSIWLILKNVLRDYPVTSVRLGRNMYRGGNVLMHVFKFFLNSSINRINKPSKRYFGSADDFDSYTKGMKKKELEDFIRKNDIEIMVHPMFDDNGNLTDSLNEFKKNI